MDLSVRLFAVLRERAGTHELRIEGLPDDLDVAGLKREIERRHPELGRLASVAGVVGTEYAPDTRKLRVGDDVALLPPVSGGSPSTNDEAALRAGVFELTAAPIDPDAARTRVAHASCGAIALFVGTTRDEARGQRVVRLEYEAFEAMTLPEMGRIFVRCRAEVVTEPARELRMLCVHRTGVVEIGQASVAIAVASPHRDAAFAACRFLIDELKKSLPVWKKEIYASGEAWIGDRS
ncbi:MAG: molybdenum cofactor biosynthesis protein [Planctomycetota bacterium]